MSWLNGMWKLADRAATPGAHGAAAPPEVGQAKLDESNLAGIGSQADVDARVSAAKTETAFRGAGQRVGLQIWRVENKRTASGAPAFGVKKWPKAQYGQFFDGDAYLVLNTYRPLDPLTRRQLDKLAFDVHFFLGKHCSQDERGVAAYKTVELDDLLGGAPVQHREVQAHESKLFQSYFEAVKYLEGGIASGFNHVTPEKYEPRLFMLRSSRKTTRAFQVPPKATSMNHGDSFVLDTGLLVYRWVGSSSSFFERNKSGLLQSNLVGARSGKAKKMHETDDFFWETLGGTEDDVRPADDPFLPDDLPEDRASEARLDAATIRLFRISDKSGSATFKAEGSGPLRFAALDSNDVFLVASNVGLFIWQGKHSSKQERNSSFKFADDFIKDEGLSNATTVTVLNEMNCIQNHLFTQMFAI